MDLANLRNNLLHGTWFIGYECPHDPYASEFFVSKLTASKAGLTSIELPKTAAELRALAQRCEKTGNWIHDACFGFVNQAMTRSIVHFRYDEKREQWVRAEASGEESLP